jgi:tRNA(Ile)-lysidine synthase
MPLAGFAGHFLATFPDMVGQKVLVALSGGPDSVALLHLLRADELELQVGAAHVHHGIRGEEADRDASFCEVLCAELEIPYHLRRIDPNGPLTSGREGTWRRLRYQALLEVKGSFGFAAVATGHHRDDVAEGALVQLLRGGGPRALAGIASATEHGVIRPLLPWTRREIRAWLEARGIGWRNDSSNTDLDLLRNRVRLRLLPELEAASPAFRKHLVHLTETLAADEAHLAAELAAVAPWIDPWEPAGGVLVDAIREMSASLRSRWLHAQAARIGIERVTRRQTALFGELLENGRPRAVTLGGRWRLRLARGRLWLEPPTPAAVFSHRLEIGRIIDLPLPGWSVRLRSGGDPVVDTRWSCNAPVGPRLEVRSPAPDDLVATDGGIVRISTLVSRRLPRHLRSIWPVFCEDDRIYWIPGVWQDPSITGRKGHLVEVMRREQTAGRV